MSYSIMLDAGHGGRDPGAVYNGRREKDDTLSLTLAIGELLQEHGIDVLYTRTTDIYESPYQKALEANAAGADFFLSIHRNSYPTDNTVSGVESLVYNKSGLKYTMAQNINEGLGSSRLHQSRRKRTPRSGRSAPYTDAGGSGRSRIYQL